MAKTKISVTVDSKLIEEIDRLDVDASRSEIVEAALARWLGNRRRQTLESEIERYYRELTRGEKDEDAEWAAASAGSLKETWE